MKKDKQKAWDRQRRHNDARLERDPRVFDTKPLDLVETPEPVISRAEYIRMRNQVDETTMWAMRENAKFEREIDARFGHLIDVSG